MPASRHILLPKDYVRYRLTGGLRHGLRPMAPGRSCSTSRQRDWSAEVLAALEIPPDWLPPTSSKARRSPARSPPRPPRLTGLKAGTPVVARRRRPGRRGGGRRGGAAGHRVADPGHLRRGLCHHRLSRSSSRRAACTPSAMPCPGAGT